VVHADEFVDDPEPPMSKQQKQIWETLVQTMAEAGGEDLNNTALVKVCESRGIHKSRVTEALQHFEAENLATVDRKNKPYKIRLKDPILG
jgi:hypothetical protein